MEGFNLETLGREFAQKTLDLLPRASSQEDLQEQKPPLLLLGRHSSIREVEEELSMGVRGSLLDNLGRELAGTLMKQEEARRSLSGRDATLKDLEKREFVEGNRSSLLDNFGRDLFQRTTAAGAWPAYKHVCNVYPCAQSSNCIDIFIFYS